MNKYKTILREELRQKRRHTSPTYRKQASQMIIGRLTPYLQTIQPKRIHCYLSTDREVLTEDIIQYSHQNGVEVFSWIPTKDQYLHTQITPETTWNARVQGVPIPSSIPIERCPAINVVIVPLLGFDQNCNRLGHGQGTYDKFLPKHPESITIGLAFEYQQIPIITCESHDIPLDYIITERRTFTKY